MQEEAIARLVEALKERHPREFEAPGDSLSTPLELQLRQSLDRLPDVEAWKLSATEPAAYLLPARDDVLLFTVRLTPRVEVQSQPLRSDRLIVRVEWGKTDMVQTTLWQHTHWTFRYEGQESELEDWQHVDGKVSVKSTGGAILPDEDFARALAARAGWSAAIIDRNEIRRID